MFEETIYVFTITLLIEFHFYPVIQRYTEGVLSEHLVAHNLDKE